MKTVAIMVVLLSGFYIGATKLVMTQLQGMQDFYSHIDQYSSQALQQNNTQPMTIKPLQTMTNPVNLR